MAQPAGEISFRIERLHDYEFRVLFDDPGYGEIQVDEPPPLGKGQGPNPARLLAAAIGSCLSASLVFCLGRAKHKVGKMTSDVRLELVRNERKRLRVGRVHVTLHPELEAGASIADCLEAFEDYCVVTQSVRDGIDVEVQVEPIQAAAQELQGDDQATQPLR